LAIRAESREGQDLLTPPQEQDITTTTPFFKNHPARGGFIVHTTA
jgi:hypothetical protein